MLKVGPVPVGPTRSGEIEISDFILGELNLSFLDICISSSKNIRLYPVDA